MSGHRDSYATTLAVKLAPPVVLVTPSVAQPGTPLNVTLLVAIHAVPPSGEQMASLMSKHHVSIQCPQKPIYACLYTLHSILLTAHNAHQPQAQKEQSTKASRSCVYSAPTKSQNTKITNSAKKGSSRAPNQIKSAKQLQLFSLASSNVHSPR